MAVNELVLVGLAACYAALFWWAFRVLPGEGWQFLAAVPLTKRPDGQWVGLNLTYYGAFTASAVVIAVAWSVVLMSSVGVSLSGILMLAAILLGACVPSAKGLARLIEGKANTFTVGGASMFGLLLLPWVVAVMNVGLGASGADSLPMTAVLAVVSIAYAFGEGTGRLACLSFGCCYGAPLEQSHRWLSILFARHHAAFSESTRKAAYERHLDAIPLIPVQAMTAGVCVAAGIVGLWLFLQGHFLAAFLVTVLVTQVWRVVSEYLRADYRGGHAFSRYQLLSLAGVVYAGLLTLWLPDGPSAPPDLLRGVHTLWQPGVLIGLQMLWVVMFLFTGRSRVTQSTVSMQVAQDQI